MAYFKDKIFRENEEPKKFNALGVNKKGVTVKKSNEQIGTSIKSIDVRRKALPPGKRVSKNGKTYYERRRSRSDLLGELL